MKLTAYIIDGCSVDIRPAPAERTWMETTNQRYAYRCLPLSIANAHGWQLLCPSSFSASWDGRNSNDAITIAGEPGTVAPAVSHFGHGVLTFHVACLFRTEPGFDLMVQGPVNQPKDAISPLSGIIETDWAPYTFTMNWLFTRERTTIRFEKGEPFCHIFILRRGELESIEPELRLLSENPDLKRDYDAWTNSRGQFILDLRSPGTSASAEQWQKLYHRGLLPDRVPAAVGQHRTRIRLKPFQKAAKGEAAGKNS